MLGEGMLILGVFVVTLFRYAKWSVKMPFSRFSGHGLGRVHPADPGAGQREQEILEPRAPAELAVGHDLEADALLQPDGVDDGLVFQGFQLGKIERAGHLAVLVAFSRGAGLQQLGGAQQAAHVFGSKRRGGTHETPSPQRSLLRGPGPGRKGATIDKR
jgi:hypothetical protein